MTLHATLSPSSASRWISCPASVRMSETVPVAPDSAYAQEGTAAHALAELMARDQILGKVTGAQLKKALASWRLEFSIADDAEAEMVDHAQAYVDYLRSRLEANPGSQLLLEQRLPTGVPDCWGTSDAVIVSPTTVESVDFKYGLGVRVEAEENPQLRLYGIGALEAFGDLLGEVKTVRLTIYQPRLRHVATEEISASDLRTWRDSILPIAESALGPDAPFGPSEEACRWCPVSGQCKAQMEWATLRDFGSTADFMDEYELSEALQQIPMIEAWCSAVKDYCLNRVYSEGKPIPGYKVVMSGGRRSIVDPAAAIEALKAIGYALDQVAVLKPKGIGELEKLLKDDFDIAVGPFVEKSEGSPALVPESDRRQAINPEGQAAKDFS